MALTDTRLRTLKPKGRAECLVADGRGLYIRIRANRDEFSRTWQFRRKESGKITITTLGTYPDLSIKDARSKAAELTKKRSGHSPTVQEAADQWLAERVDHTHRKADQVRGYVDRAIIPALGNKRVRDVEAADISRIIRSYRDRVAQLPRARTGGRPAARALLAVFKGLFGYAVANGWISQSPAAQLTAAITGQPPDARARVLSDDEIRFVMTTTVKAGPVMRFLLLTGLRLGEAYNGHRKRHASFLAPLAAEVRDHRAVDDDVADAQTDDLRHSCAGIVHQAEKRSISLACPGSRIRRIEDRLHLLARQKSKYGPVKPLHRNGQRLLDHRERGKVVMGGILQEGSKRRQTGVAAARAVVPVLLQMIEKAEDQSGVEIDQCQCNRRLADPGFSEAEQQSERVAIGGDGAWADGSLAAQVLDEEALEQGGKRRRRDRISHGDPPRRWPRRARSARPRSP